MGVALTLAVSAALLLGTSDFFAARSARTTPAITVTRTAVATSVALSPLLLFLVHSEWIAHDLLLGAASGVSMSIGLLLLYQGYAVARMGIVAPLSSVLLASVPVLWGVFNGQHTSATAATGMGIGVIALVLTSYTPGGAGSVSVGVALGLTSGVAFGVAFTFMGQASKAAGLTPVIVQRGTGFLVLAVLGLVRGEPFVAKGEGRPRAMLAGLLGLLAIGALQLAFQRGQIGPVAVASSQFATVAVLLSVLLNRERMRWWQSVGVGATAIAVALIAAG